MKARWGKNDGTPESKHWNLDLMLLPNFTNQSFDILKGKVKTGHDHQNDGGGKDDTEAQ